MDLGLLGESKKWIFEKVFATKADFSSSIPPHASNTNMHVFCFASLVLFFMPEVNCFTS